MLASIQAKLIAAAILLLALAAAVIGFGAHERSIGAAAVQAKWDATKAAQTTLAAKASESARDREHQQATDFAGIAHDYLQDTTHAYPSIADALPAAVAAGAVQLRHDCPAADRGGVPEAAARSRGVDVAAAAAATQRLATAVAAVRVGDASDARERQLRAQVTALQAILRAERKP